MITQKISQNAHKFTYLVERYPNHSAAQIIAMFEMPGIDINTALWAAVEQGFIIDPKAHEGVTGIVHKPSSWSFGPEVEKLQEQLVYAFEHLAENETDMEEITLNGWVDGYPKHDFAVVMNRLLETGVLAEYQFEDTHPENDSKYTYFTLQKNLGKEWARHDMKDFKESQEG